MQMPFLVRSRNDGKTYELRVKHGLLIDRLVLSPNLRIDLTHPHRRSQCQLEHEAEPFRFGALLKRLRRVFASLQHLDDALLFLGIDASVSLEVRMLPGASCLSNFIVRIQASANW
jgi:hypothetical protein